LPHLASNRTGFVFQTYKEHVLRKSPIIVTESTHARERVAVSAVTFA